MKKYISILIILILILNISVYVNRKFVKGAVGDDFNSVYFSINNLMGHDESFTLEGKNKDLTSVSYVRKNSDGSIDVVELENSSTYRYILLQTKIKEQCSNALSAAKDNYKNIVSYVEYETGIGKGEFDKLILEAQKSCGYDRLPIKIFHKIDEEFYSYILVTKDGEDTVVSVGVGNSQFYKYWIKQT